MDFEFLAQELHATPTVEVAVSRAGSIVTEMPPEFIFAALLEATWAAKRRRRTVGVCLADDVPVECGLVFLNLRWHSEHSS
jgi:hypothetical protein